MIVVLEVLLDLYFFSALSRRLVFWLVIAFIVVGGLAMLSNMTEPKGF